MILRDARGSNSHFEWDILLSTLSQCHKQAWSLKKLLLNVSPHKQLAGSENMSLYYLYQHCKIYSFSGKLHFLSALFKWLLLL